MSWLDIVVIAILIISIILGFSKGLVNTLASIVSFVLSLVVANIYYKKLSEYIALNTKIDDNIFDFVSNRFGEIEAVNSNSWLNTININNIPEGAKQYINEIVNNTTQSGITVIDNFSNNLTTIILHIISFFAIFLAVKIIIYILAHVLDSISKLPVINIINRFGGGILGILEGVIINIIIISIVYTFAMVTKNDNIINAINSSSFASYFYIGYIFFN